jgi:hypothetical protein
VIDLIKKRTSSRSYEKRPIDSLTMQKLKEYLTQVNQDSSIKSRFEIVYTEESMGNPIKLGTYGIISGATTFIVGIISKDEKEAQAFGFLFEKIILKATDLGLQTCWLGGTFKKSDFKHAADIKENEYIAIVSPVGYRRDKQRLLEKAMRAFAGSDNRKPWNELYFNQTSTNPLNESNAEIYTTPLEMVRLSPSASNKQPWRIIKDNDMFHFFLCRTKGYWVTTFDMQKNDIGIAMCHFEISASELGLLGHWQKLNEISTPEQYEYISSWVCNND